MDRSLTAATGSPVPAPEAPPQEGGEITDASAAADPAPGAPLLVIAGEGPPAEPVADPEPAAQVRRPPYGRNPVLAAHGVRARAEIIAAARELFTRNGYQGTTVESIGEATGRSGAAVYQYFHGKSEIFGIFLAESGIELEALGDAFPLLTDDADGDAMLQQWLFELIDLLNRYQSNFLMWASIQYTEPALAAIGRRNLGRFQHGIAQQVAAAGAHPPTPAIVPVGILSAAQWSYFMLRARNSPISQERLVEVLAGLLRAYLFAAWVPDDSAPVVAVADEELPNIPLGDAMGLRRPVTARGVGTVQRILLAAADRFRVAGFQGTSLSDIATAAGVSHASVYTYWADRDALFTTLARDALTAVRARVEALPEMLGTPQGLAGWIDGWVGMLAAHGSVLYVWTHEVDNPLLADLTDQMHQLIDRVGLQLIESADPGTVSDPEALAVVLRAVLTDVPYALSVQLGILPRDTACGFVTGLLAAALGTSGGTAQQ